MFASAPTARSLSPRTAADPIGEAAQLARENSTRSFTATEIIRDRQMLSKDGMFVIIATVALKTGKLRKSPDIISRGFIYLRESQDLLNQSRLLIKKTVEG